MKSVCFEVLRVDCIHDGESWVTNDIDVIGCFSTKGNAKRALMRFLNQHGFKFKKGTILIEDDGEIDTSSIDAWCVDEIIQYALFNDIVFG